MIRPLSNLSPADAARAEPLRALFDMLHWGRQSGHVYQVDDPLVPDAVQMGGHEALHLITPEGEEVQVTYSGHLAVEYDLAALARGLPVARLFDDDRVQRLLLVGDRVPDAARQFAARRHQGMQLGALAARVGGRQARFPSPAVLVVPIGEVTHVVYATDKLGDGYSHYIHKFSEESGGPRPWLAVDAVGRSWLAGGSYTVPPEGITD